MVTTIIKTVGVGKTYTTLSAWEIARRGNLVTRDSAYPGTGGDPSGTIEVAEVYGGGSVGAVSISSWTVDATHYPWIRAATGESHGGTFNVNKAYLTSVGRTVDLNIEYIRLGPGLSISSTWSGEVIRSYNGLIAPTTIEGNIIYSGPNSYTSAILYYYGSVTHIVKNCIVKSTLFQWSIGCTGGTVKCNVINCTLIGGISGANSTSQNSYIMGCNEPGVLGGANDAATGNRVSTALLRNIPYADSTTQVWVEAGYNSLPIALRFPSTASYNSKIWIIGGCSGIWYDTAATRKVYSSTDGITWIEAGTNALPVGTGYHTSLVFNSKMWVIGGVAGGAATRKVYSSTDGITWTEAGTNALPVATYSHSSVVFDSKIWVIGGNAAGAATRKVYSSTDGITWTEAGTDALPVATYAHASVIFDSKMWVIGGNAAGAATRKVYSSTDGITWNEAGTNALPVATYWHSSAVLSGKIWVIGGTSDGSGTFNCVYYSVDGIAWNRNITDSLPYRSDQHSSIIHNSKIWTIGGEDHVANFKTVYSFPNTPTFAPFQSVTNGSENLRPVVSMSNKLLDSGANLTSEGVTTDIVGIARPQNGAFDIGAFENDIPLCWNYTAQYKNSNKLFKASGCGPFPRNLQVPSNVDISTGKMVDDGVFISPDKYNIC